MTPAQTSTASWRQANDAYLASELRCLRLRIEGAACRDLEDAERDRDQRLASLREAGTPPPLDLLVHGFGLGSFERQVVLLCLAPEVDPEFGSLFAHAQEDPAAVYPTPRLAAAWLQQSGWHSFQGHAPLRRFRLMRAAEAGPLIDMPLGLTERVAAYLIGFNEIDDRVAALCHPVRPVALTPRQEDLAMRVAEWMQPRLRKGFAPRLNVTGSMAKVAVAQRACAIAGLDLRRVDAARLTAADEELTRLLEREATLMHFAAYVEPPAGDTQVRAAVEDLLGRLTCPILLGTLEPWPSAWPLISVETPRASQEEQAALWIGALGEPAEARSREIESVVQQFDFGPEEIARAAEVARGLAGFRGATELGAADLRKACRAGGLANMEGLARHIVPCYGWEDIVLPESLRRQLVDVAGQVARRHEVYVSWGFGQKLNRGRGITALFAGPSGTGKTMAAEVLAHELDLDLYRIDLSQIVSKWIGETEKNLARLFDAAERSGAVLFFDEADALFGKRTEVSDSHDRYANIEVDYLLQRMEEYRGLAILATNMKAQLDQAFLRRLRFVLDFPFPNFQQRRRMWERVFPPEAPLGDVSLDLLARLEVPGGNIRNIAINAAFLAATAGSPIQMDHLMRSAVREYGKEERLVTRDEFGAWSERGRE